MLYICLLCGAQTNDVSQHYYAAHTEWYHAVFLKETNVTMRSGKNWWIETTFISETKQNLHKSEREQDNIFFMKTKKFKPNIKSHIPPNNNIKHHLKPWRDPESLFCDSEFLEELLDKPIQNDKQCIN